MIIYRATLDVPRELVWFVARLLRAERKARGTRKGTRLLTCYQQALFELAWFREKKDIPTLGRGLGLSQPTSYRHLNEVIKVLSAQAPDLHAALDRAKDEGMPTSSSTARSSTPTGSTSRPSPRRARRSTAGTPGRLTTSAGTSRPSCLPGASPYGLPGTAAALRDLNRVLAGHSPTRSVT